MNKFTTISVGATATGETLVDALAGIGERKRNIISLRYAHSATDAGSGAPANSLYTKVRAYRNQEQVVDYSLGSFRWAMVSNLPYLDESNVILCDVDLQKGDGFKVGFSNDSAIPYGAVVMEYRDLE